MPVPIGNSLDALENHSVRKQCAVYKQKLSFS